MKKYFFLLLFSISLTGLISCSGPKGKIAGKWIVTSASLFDERLKDTTKFKSAEDEAAFRSGFEDPYKRAEYDFNKDGTFAFKNSTAQTLNGKWDIGNGTVIMIFSDGKEQDWTFTSGKVEIFADSSMLPQLQLGGGSYLGLVLKPVPGHTVKPDYP